MDHPNRQFQFDKGGQLFTRSHNEPLSVVAMCVDNPFGAALRIHG
jgi:hypothetical protein